VRPTLRHNSGTQETKEQEKQENEKAEEGNKESVRIECKGKCVPVSNYLRNTP
jgi:hypothetical protein